MPSRPKSGKQALLPEVEIYLHLLLLLYLIDKKTYDVVSCRDIYDFYGNQTSLKVFNLLT